MNLIQVKRALISVSDKENVVELCAFLAASGVEILSTGGTFKLLQKNNIDAIEVSDFTKSDEILSGRVKTLHPKIHGGILADLSDENHLKQMSEYGIKSIDLVVVNLYPFEEVVEQGCDYQKAVDNIDIGGPCMIRAAAKNHNCKLVVTNKDQYQMVIDSLGQNNMQSDFNLRKKLAIAAFKMIFDYDQAISEWFLSQNDASESQNDTVFAKNIEIDGKLKQVLRYGENSHQKGALYVNEGQSSGIVNGQQIQGKELSFNNLADMDAAYQVACDFKENGVCVIIKHANICGIAFKNNISDAFDAAFECDSKSAFGGIVALNGKLDGDLATKIAKIFFEVIIVSEIDDRAREILAAKKNLRVIIADFKLAKNTMDFKAISGGFLLQQRDEVDFNANDLEFVGDIKPSDEQIEQLLFAMKVAKFVKSNAIVVAGENQSYGIGAGQVSRVDALSIACDRAENYKDLDGNVINKANGGVLASDAFFPFADNIEIAAKYGIKAIIAPSGSVRDGQVIEAAIKHKIALVFIKTRHFKH